MQLSEILKFFSFSDNMSSLDTGEPLHDNYTVDKCHVVVTTRKRQRVVCDKEETVH